MAQNIKLKRSALPGKVPTTSSIDLGEIAINTYDGKVFFKKSGSAESVQSIVATNSITTGSITLTQTGSFGELVITQDANIGRDIYVTNDIIGNGDLDIAGSLTASIPQGYIWVGDGSNQTKLVATSSLVTGGSGTTFSGSSNVNNRVITATGTTPELFGEANLTFDGTTLVAPYFQGNGSGLTNLTASISETATVTASFTNQISTVVTHNFNSKNVIVSVYDTTDSQIIPESITLTDTNNVTITFAINQSGYAVVAKGGHIVSGSAASSTNLTSLNTYTASLITAFTASGADVTFNGNQIMRGALTVGTSSLGATENTLTLGPSPAGGTGEGGQIMLQASGGIYTSASMIDNYQNQTRLLRGTNAGSDAVVAAWNMGTKQMQLPAYNSTTAFTATTLVGLLGFDTNGNILTTTTGSGGGGTPVTITNNTDNYIITATGTANTINGESNLQFNGSTLSVTGNITATAITSSGAVIAQANGAMYFRGGDDAELWDINVANTIGIYGQQDQTVASIKLGSGGGTISGKSGNIGIGTTDPTSGTLHVNGNIFATSLTGSLASTNGVVSGSSQVIGILSSLNLYTSSQDTKNSTLATYTGSIDTKFTTLSNVTGSLITSASNTETKFAAVATVTGSLITSASNDATKFTSLATVTGSLITSASNTETKFASLATITGSLITSASNTETKFSTVAIYTASVDTKFTAVGNSTSSLNAFTASASSSIFHLNASSASQQTSIDALNTFSGSQITKNSSLATITGSLITSASNTETKFTALATYTASVDTKFTAVGSSTSSLNSFTSSASSSIFHLNASSASQQIGIDALNTFSGSQITKNSALANTTGSLITSASNSETKFSVVATYTASVDTKFTAVGSSTSSLNSFTASASSSVFHLNASSASQQISIDALNTFSGSQITKNSALANVTGSLITSASNTETKFAAVATYTGSNNTKWTALESVSSSFARTNVQNTFTANQTISGSLTVTQDLVVLGSSSITNVSSSTLNIGTNLITVAVNQPSVRFGGLAVVDSGSAGSSGSFLYDSVQDEFIFLHKGDGTNITSSHFVLGPETYNNLGNETYLTNNRVPKGTGKEHLNDSNITDNGSVVSINSNTQVTGSLVVSNGITGSIAATNGVVSGSSQIVGILGSLNSYTASQDTKNLSLANTTGSLNSYTSSQDTKNSALAVYTGSVDTKFTSLSNVTASLNASTASLNSKTGSYATTGSNSFTGSQSILGNLTATSITSSGDMKVNGLTIGQGGANDGTTFGDTRGSSGNYCVSIGDTVADGASGDYNTGVGFWSLRVLSTGEDNTSIGSFAMDSLTTGNANTAVGSNVLGAVTTGSNNIAIGYRAANSTTNADTSIFIGNNTNPKATNQVNQIVIGDSATGLGSNTSVIGNSSTTLTGIYGNFVLGSTAIANSTNSGYTLNVSAPSTNGALLVSGSSVITGSLTVTDGIIGSIQATNGVVSGSSQIVGILSSLNTYTSSTDTKFVAVQSSTSSLNSYTSSQDTRNTNFESKFLAVQASTASLNSFTSSINTTIKTQLNTNTVVSGSSQVNFTQLSGISANIISASTDSSNVDFIISGGSITANLFGGVVSGSSQITAGSTTNFATDVKTQLNSNTVVSSSLQISAFGFISGSFETTGRGIVSGSSQITPLLPTGTISGSSQVNGSLITTNTVTINGTPVALGGSATISAQIEEATTVTASFTNQSSVAVTHNFNSKNLLVSVYNTDDDQIIPKSVTLTNNNTATITLSSEQSGYIVVAKGGHIVTGSIAPDWATITNKPAGIVSSSAQITALGFASGSTIHSGSTGNYQFNSIGVGTPGSAVAGEIRATGDIVAFYSSDERLKENIQPIENALTKVESISGNRYNWKSGFETIHSHTGSDLGVIAQEVQSVLPEVVTERETGYLAVDYVKLVPVLIEAIKELSEKVKQLQNK